jgi:hypothetical protein
MYNAGSPRKRGRVVEGSSLENCRRGNPFVSSNLTASARILINNLAQIQFKLNFSASDAHSTKRATQFMSPSIVEIQFRIACAPPNKSAPGPNWRPALTRSRYAIEIAQKVAISAVVGNGTPIDMRHHSNESGLLSG